MTYSNALLGAGLMAATLVVGACASAPPPEAKAQGTEARTAAALERDFEEAAKGYTQTERDGVVLYCKKYRNIGSNIAKMNCLTESQLRQQVQDMDQYREQLRNRSGKCTAGRQGGGGPCGAN